MYPETDRNGSDFECAGGDSPRNESDGAETFQDHRAGPVTLSADDRALIAEFETAWSRPPANAFFSAWTPRRNSALVSDEMIEAAVALCVRLGVPEEIARRPVTYAIGQGEKDRFPQQYTTTSAELVVMWCLIHRPGDKHGLYLTECGFGNATRANDHALASYLLIPDFEGGDSRDAQLAALRASGHFWIVWNTYSDGGTSVKVAESTVKKIAGEDFDPDDIDPEVLWTLGRDALIATKGYLPALFEGCAHEVEWITETRGKGDDVKTTRSLKLTTAPHSRLRAVGVLREPHSGGNEDWKARKKALLGGLGVAFDEAATDKARLSYLPRRAKRGDYVPYVEVIPGELIDLPEVEAAPEAEAKAKAKTSKAKTRQAGAEAHAASGSDVGAELVRFAAAEGKAFQPCKMIEDVTGEKARNGYGHPEGHRSYECPWADYHSTGDPEKETAFFARDSKDGDDNWTMRCEHAGCIARAEGENGKHDRLKVLQAFMEQHRLTVAHMWKYVEAGGLEFQTADGKRTASVYNLRLAFAKDGIALAHDGRLDKVTVTGLPGGRGIGTALDDAAFNHIRISVLKDQYRIDTAAEALSARLDQFALDHWHHPVRDYLAKAEAAFNARGGGGTLERMLIDHLGADDTPFVRAVTLCHMIAAVRRARRAPWKHDEMIVLIGRQGVGKSTFIASLAPDGDWYTDTLALGKDSKIVIEQTAGKLLVEIPELSGMHKSEVEKIKAQLSRTVDESRMAYDRFTKAVPRAFVMWGTTNAGTFLRDLTANRRFWPVAVSKPFDPAGMTDEVRLMLWGEAAARETAGESNRLDPALWGDAAAAQAERQVHTKPFEALEAWFGGGYGRVLSVDVTTALLRNGTQAEPEDIREMMAKLGWEKGTKQFKGKHGQKVFSRAKPGTLDNALEWSFTRDSEGTIAWTGAGPAGGELADGLAPADGLAAAVEAVHGKMN